MNKYAKKNQVHSKKHKDFCKFSCVFEKNSPLDQRKLLFDQLPNEYAHKVLIVEAKTQGISPRTAFRWNEKWLMDGFIEKVQQNGK